MSIKIKGHVQQLSYATTNRVRIGLVLEAGVVPLSQLASGMLMIEVDIHRSFNIGAEVIVTVETAEEYHAPRPA